jgi:hypothetical protein
MTSRCTAAEPSPRLRHPSPFCKAKRARGQESIGGEKGVGLVVTDAVQ